MTHNLVPDEHKERSLEVALERLIHSAKELGSAALSPATNRAYTSDLLLYCDWCAQHDFLAFPAEPQTIALYAAALHEQDRAVATIRRRIVSTGINRTQFHRDKTNPPGPLVYDPLCALLS